MIKEFRISNFKSINNEQIISTEACAPREVTEFPSHVISYRGERLLKLSSFYGPNGGGKSNLIDALYVMIAVIFNKELANQSIGFESSFKCVFSSSNYSTFEIFFVSNNYEIGYSLSVDLTKILEKQSSGINVSILSTVDYKIIREELIYRSLSEKNFITLFERNEFGIVTSSILKNIDLINNSLALPYSKTFINYFISSFSQDSNTIEFNPIFEFTKEINSVIYFSREYRAYSFDNNSISLIEPHLPKVVEILNSVDIKVTKLKFHEVFPNTYCLYVYRDLGNGTETKLQLQNESKGTKKLINIIIDVLTNENASIFVADDFDAFLHPKLIKAVIDLFASENNKTKQLIFNSHDIVNMNNKTFRRDEIWFAYRNEKFETNYIPLSNIIDYRGKMVRKDAVYGKQYLEGKYGADPFIKHGLNWSN